MTLPLYRRFPLGAPMALPLLAVVGVLLAPWGWAAAAAALAWALGARAWRVAALCVAAALLCWLHSSLLQSRAEALRTGEAAQELRGTVSEVYPYAFILQPEGLSPALLLHGQRLALEAGDCVQVRVLRRSAPPPPAIPGMFDRAAWWRSRGIAAEGDVLELRLEGHPLSWAALRACGLRLRQRAARVLMPEGTEEDARRQLLAALVLGARDEAQLETQELFRRGGCMHAFAVSGLHVGLVAGFCWLLFRCLRVRPSVARPVLLLLLAVYVVVTGCAVPALRAYLMVAVFMLGMMLRQRVSCLNTWCAAACLFLLAQPQLLHHAGFLLSFAVYAAILGGVSFCLRHDSPWFGPDAYLPYRVQTAAEQRLRTLERSLRSLVVVSCCAWLVSLPLTALFFHCFNSYAVLTNVLLALPLSLCMACGLLALLTAWVPLLGELCMGAALLSARAVLLVVGSCASIPGAYLPAVPPAPPDTVLHFPLGIRAEGCLLGNPGVLMICGTPPRSAPSTVRSVLFHAHARAAAVVGAPELAQELGCAVFQPGNALHTASGDYRL
ncbi:MAG: ComEC/Rec2 family competence protein, partial [Akkermansia sp.]